MEYPRYHCDTTVSLPGLLLDMRLVSLQDFVQGTKASTLEAKKRNVKVNLKKCTKKILLLTPIFTLWPNKLNVGLLALLKLAFLVC